MATEKRQEDRYTEYPLFKGLQKPLEFMGIQGRYIYWAAGAVGGAIVGFILAYCLIGFLAGLIALVVTLGGGAALVFLKQRKGASHQEGRQRRVHLCVFKENVKPCLSERRSHEHRQKTKQVNRQAQFSGISGIQPLMP